MSEEAKKFCDCCMNRRKCQSIDSGIRVGTKPCFVNICQWCRARETRNARGKAKPKPGEWVDRVYPLQFAGKHLRDGEEEAGCGE